MPTNLFSVRWSGSFEFEDGDHRFTTVSDDGIRLSVDGVWLIDDWTVQGDTTNSAAALQQVFGA